MQKEGTAISSGPVETERARDATGGSKGTGISFGSAAPLVMIALTWGKADVRI